MRLIMFVMGTDKRWLTKKIKIRMINLKLSFERHRSVKERSPYSIGMTWRAEARSVDK